MTTKIKKQRRDKIDSFIKPIPANGKEAEAHLKKKQPIPRSVSISSEKKLVQFQADSPSVCYTTMKELHLTKQAVAKQLSDPLKKAIPVILIFGGIMGIAVVMSNAPPVIDAVADRVSGKPDVFVMTPEEYEQWEIDNGLKEEKDRRYVAGLSIDEYQKYLDAGGTAPQFEEKTFLGVTQSDDTSKTDTFLGVPQENTDSAVQTYLGVPVDPALEQGVEPMPMVDFIPPVLTAPEVRTFEADNTNGMKAKFNVIVEDNVDEGLIAECVPSRNKVLAPGSHEVKCTATDSSDNVGSITFIINIDVREGVEPVSIIPKIQPMPGQSLP